MKKPNSIPYVIESKITDTKAMIWAIGVALSIPIMIILGVVIGLPLSIIGIILLTKALNKADGEVRIVQNDPNRGVVLFENTKTGSLEEFSFLKKEFSWHYMYHSSTERNNMDGPSHVNYIELILTFYLADGRKIGLVEGLYPWQEIPKNWTYNLFDKKAYSELYITSGLKKFNSGEKVNVYISN